MFPRLLVRVVCFVIRHPLLDSAAGVLVLAWYQAGWLGVIAAVTSAAGLAMGGMHPVVAIYATFLNRAFDQVLMDVALHHCGVTFVLDRSGITGTSTGGTSGGTTGTHSTTGGSSGGTTAMT